MSDDIKRKRGRPKKDKCYDKVFKVCVDEDHDYMRNALMEELNKSSSEVLREALETLYRFKGGGGDDE